jgi:hypothetical protein
VVFLWLGLFLFFLFCSFFVVFVSFTLKFLGVCNYSFPSNIDRSGKLFAPSFKKKTSAVLLRLLSVVPAYLIQLIVLGCFLYLVYSMYYLNS